MADKELLEALQRSVRVADQSCTSYSVLRDRYRKLSFILDLAILLLTTWLTAMAFVQPTIAIELSPKYISKDIWLGLLSVSAFGLSIVQMQVNWKGRASTYQLAASSLHSFVKEYRHVLACPEVSIMKQGILRYQTITDALEPIPESQFLYLKKKHLLKVYASRHLDAHPGTNLLLLRVICSIQDNWSSIRKFHNEKNTDRNERD